MNVGLVETACNFSVMQVTEVSTYLAVVSLLDSATFGSNCAFALHSTALLG